MIKSLHLFVTVVKRQDNPFSEFVREIHQKPGTEIIELSLTHNQFKAIQKVEYSRRRFFRFLYYQSIFKFLKKKISEILSERNFQTKIYLSDEGVWSEVVKTIIRGLGRKDVKIVVIQHGIHFHTTPDQLSLRMRNDLNYLFRLLTGFPIFGLGFGGSRCDLYFTYTLSDSCFIRAQGLEAVEAGQKIKKDLIADVKKLDKGKHPQRVALFALQPTGKQFGFLLAEDEYYHKLKIISRYISTEHSFQIVFRPHPGSNQTNLKKSLHDNGLLKYGSFQNSIDVKISEALSQADIVLAVSSTVILDAVLTGRRAIQLLESSKSPVINIGNSWINISSLQLEHDINQLLS